MLRYKSSKPKNFLVENLKRLAPQIGATLLIEKNYGHVGLISFSNGKKVFFRSERFNINPSGSVEIATDKKYSHFFLNQFGYSTPLGKAFFSSAINENVEQRSTIDDGYNYAKQLGFPVIIKPNNYSKGKLVSKVFNKTEYYKIANKILKEAQVFIVEKFYVGSDYRIIVFDGGVFAAYRREPLAVTGDGKSTVLELLKNKQTEFDLKGISGLNLKDSRIQDNLKRLKLNYESVVPSNHTIQLLDNANISTGGAILDLTENIHPDYSELAINVTRSMQLKLCGVDIITSDICSSISNYVIIEINSAPALNHYASIGVNQLSKTRNLYLRILNFLSHEV